MSEMMFSVGKFKKTEKINFCTLFQLLLF